MPYGSKNDVTFITALVFANVDFTFIVEFRNELKTVTSLKFVATLPSKIEGPRERTE